MERTGRWRNGGPSQPNLFFITTLVIGLSLLQGCVESTSRMQNSKPVFNEITPSPEFAVGTNGWRPIIPPSTIAPPKTEEEMREVVNDQLPKQPKQRVTPNHFPEESHVVTLEDLSPPPIDVIDDSQQAGDNLSQLRLRRQKKRPPFKTVEAPVIVSAGSEPLTFRVNSDQHFVRHFPDIQEAQFRHRPIETNSGAVYRAVHNPLLDSPFRSADIAPSQEMLPPTAPSRPFSSIGDGQHFRLRPQQPGFHGPHIIFHGQLPIPQQQQQQRYPVVARPADPLPGSLLRPHGDRTPLTDSSAFRTGGGSFHHRPVPVQWPNPLVEGRPSFTVTSTPLVDDRPWPSSVHHNGERHPEMTGAATFPQHIGSQAIRGSNEGSANEESQVGETTVIIAPKNPFGTAPNVKGKDKPQREQVNPLFHVLNSAEQVGNVQTGHVLKQQSPINPSPRDPNVGVRPSKTSATEAGSPLRSSKKPFRENNDGKIVDQGFHGSESQETLKSREKQRLEAAAREIPREERPRFSGQSKFRQNTNYRKRPEEAPVESSAEMTDHFMPVSTPTREKSVPSGESGTSQRVPGYRVRKRRPKPTAHRQETHYSKPIDTQEQQQPLQDVYQSQTHQQQHHQEAFHQQDPHQKEERHHQHISQQQQQEVHQQQDYNQQQEVHQQQDYNQQQEISQQTQTIGQQDGYHQQQEANPQQQEVHQQPQEVHQPRKRPRRPTRIRKPVKEPTVDATFQKGENHLLPTGQAAVQEEEQPQRHKFRESRPRPVLRTRRPRPEVSPSPLPIQNSATAPDDTGFVKEELPFDRPKKVRIRPPIRQEQKEIYNEREPDQFPSSAIQEPSGAYYSQNQEIRTSEKNQNSKENEPVSQEDGSIELPENSPIQIDSDGRIVFEDNVKVIDATTENAGEIEDFTQKIEQAVNIAELSTVPIYPEPQETSTVSTTSEVPVLSTTEAQTTTVAPTSSAYGIRSRLRGGSRPRFSVKDYRERLNRLSQLSGRGRNSTDSSSEAEDVGATGGGVGPTAPSKERWYPGRRQQQTLQEQQQIQHQRLQASSRNEGDPQTERPKSEGRDRYRPRAPALRPRPTAGEGKKSDETISGTKGRDDEASTTATNRYRSRFGGRYSTTTQSGSEADVTTTENPTSRRRGILTTYGLRRPYPLKLRSGVTTTTEAAIPTETTPMTPPSEITTTATPVTTEAPATTTTTTTTTAATTTTTTTEINVPTIAENEVTERISQVGVISKDSEANGNGPSTETVEVVELQDDLLRQDELISAGKGIPLIEPEEGSEEDEEVEEDPISPAQRVSDLTLWATTGNSGGIRNNGSKDNGLVTFSAVPYPSSVFSSRLVTMATEDPVLPLEAFFFGPPAGSSRSENERV